jgi:hypothetical protein
MYTHDFVACACFKNELDNQGIDIDGGSEYTKISGNFENFIWIEENV